MTFQPGLFKGKHALVTGATQGIGAAVANALAALGANVTAVGIDRGDRSLDARVDVRLADVSSEADVAALFGKLSTLDILVNCAGIIRRGWEHDVAVFEQVVAVNLTGTMRICVAARPLLAARRGVIVNTASMLSFFGGAQVPGYAASKGGVAQLTKSLALAYAADGIRVNAVAPGWIATPLTQALQQDQGRSGAILQRTPLGRWGQPEDIADAVAFLCAPASAFITGVILPVDGGYLVA
ncbi:SDR family NAD(P)-dependent oxidoreductase [Cupriavidus sp. IDO]|uniref:SDR family NAD(P)-dependent oxidoreductase n=1 Tax=Cupriavidus sp. IDO TaxID=1539142 RepID=UPI000579254D|nr:SDR family oxidoreductase [Cupriavidus sp. IDO]KWR88189.1 2-deoxy-D-gluconate 3-dehydrogenase [Cupriavidus sp. IDO]